MAVIAPNTEIILLKVPLELDEANQLTFANATAQYNYFYGLSGKKTFDKYTYQRKDNTIKVEALIDDLYGYNYVMYKNTNHSSKWFYAFITDMQYVSDKVTSLTIKTDVWQTWQFSLTYKPVLIDREHTNDDTIGANTLPEGLELGEMVVNGGTSNFGVGSDIQKFLVVADVTMLENAGSDQTLTYSWSDGTTTLPASYVNGIPSGCYHVIVGEGNSYGMPNINYFVSVYEKAGLTDAISSIYVLPKNIINNNDYKSGLTISTTGAAPFASITGLSLITSDGLSPTEMEIHNIDAPTTLNNFIPKNNKLLTWPYCYFNISNNAGTSIPYHYEDFTYTGSSRFFRFRVEGVCSQGGAIKAVPEKYKNILDDASVGSRATGNAYDYSVTGAKYPICSWLSDSYTNWLTQNAINMKAEWTSTLIAGAIGVGATALTAGMGAGLLGMTTVGAAMYGAAGGAIKAGGDLIGTAREQHLAKTQANMVPDQAKGNLNTGDLTFSKLWGQFTYLPMCVKPEIANCIDEYFSQFGYKCNRVKVPNVTGRTNWNYVKTIGCYIQADIPQDDLQEIKNMFDKGVTFWHNPSTFMDYSQSNAIVTP